MPQNIIIMSIPTCLLKWISIWHNVEEMMTPSENDVALLTFSCFLVEMENSSYHLHTNKRRRQKNGTKRGSHSIAGAYAKIQCISM